MAITLNPETERLLESKLQDGGFPSVDAVVVAALSALAEREASELDDAALDGIDEAEDQIERGAVHEWRDVRDRVRSSFAGG